MYKFLLLSQNLMLIDSNTFHTSYMISQIMRVIPPLKLGFFPAWFSRLVSSFVGVSVIGHGMMARNIAC
jgi:hypothetical protein